MKKVSIAICFILFLLLSCTNQDKQNNYLNIYCNKSSKFTIDSAGDSAGHFATQGDVDFLALKRIDKPSDTFSFRCTYGKGNEVRIFEYFNINSVSFFRIYKYPTEIRGKYLFDKLYPDSNRYIINFNSLTKGKNFLSVLETNKILELPDCQKIPVYADVEWYRSVSIEYSNKCIYRSYVYFDPYNYVNRFKEAKLLVNFLDYLKKEFDF